MLIATVCGRSMTTAKKHEVNRILKILHDIEPHAADEITEQRNVQIEYYRGRLSMALEYPEWPFAWRSFALVSFSWVASTVLPSLVQSLMALTVFSGEVGVIK